MHGVEAGLFAGHEFGGKEGAFGKGFAAGSLVGELHALSFGHEGNRVVADHVAAADRGEFASEAEVAGFFSEYSE